MHSPGLTAAAAINQSTRHWIW